MLKPSKEQYLSYLLLTCSKILVFACRIMCPQKYGYRSVVDMFACRPRCSQFNSACELVFFVVVVLSKFVDVDFSPLFFIFLISFLLSWSKTRALILLQVCSHFFRINSFFASYVQWVSRHAEEKHSQGPKRKRLYHSVESPVSSHKHWWVIFVIHEHGTWDRGT